MQNIRKTYDFLKDCGVFYIATVEGDQPRVRPFGATHLYQDRIYIHTGAKKPVSKQMHANPKVEICAFSKAGVIRIAAVAVLDESIEAQKSLLDAHPTLKDMYAPGDGNNEVWYLTNAKVTIDSAGEKDEFEF